MTFYFTYTQGVSLMPVEIVSSVEIVRFSDSIRDCGLAYIVNIPMGRTDASAPGIQNLVAGLLAAKDSAGPPVAIVLGINANGSWVKSSCLTLNLLVAELRKVSQGWPPMTVQFIEWTGNKFPYGTVRNTIKNSDATEKYVNQLISEGFDVYIACTDSDSSARTTPCGKNIFDAVAETLGDLRPVLVAGGYRCTRDVPQQEAAVIHDDMVARDRLFRLNPLGPYYPEPNLFICALAADHLEFGPQGAEFENLRTDAGQFAVKELNEYFEDSNIPGELEAWRACYLQNNTHPWRGRVFYASFVKLSVETDTARLLKKLRAKSTKASMTSRFNLVAQHHRGSNQAKSSFMKSRYRGANDKGAFLRIRTETNKSNKTLKFVNRNLSLAMRVVLTEQSKTMHPGVLRIHKEFLNRISLKRCQIEHKIVQLGLDVRDLAASDNLTGGSMVTSCSVPHQILGAVQASEKLSLMSPVCPKCESTMAYDRDGTLKCSNC
jgi:hypothetical protein